MNVIIEGNRLMSTLTVILSYVLPLVTAFAIGVLAAFAPCSLTSSLAAVSYVTARISDSRRTALAGLAYAAGRAVTYTVLGLIIFWLGLEAIESTEVLRTAGGAVIGLIFILAGAVMLEKVRFDFAFGSRLQAAFAEKLYGMGVPGAFGLGAVFALAFCPYLASLYFGALLPLAFATPGIGVSLPAIFGVGSALPVVAFALLASAGVATAKSYADRVRQVEPLIRKLFGATLIVFGAYLILITIM